MPAAANTRPYLSIVATSRNDGHGGDLLDRMQVFLDGLALHCAERKQTAELILVEWNPPGDRPPLAEVCRFGQTGGHLRTRLITVPPRTHASLENAAALPMFQMIAKNVGIRRARGDYVLATNVDILCSEPLSRWLAGRPLRDGTFYRVDRHDVNGRAPKDISFEQKLVWHGQHVIREAGPTGVRSCDYRYAVHGRGLIDRVGRRYRAQRARQPAEAALGTAWRILRDSIERRGKARRIPPLHFHAAGDFTLMSRRDWFALRGYPELPTYSWNLDALFLVMAFRHGMSEHRRDPPEIIYHLDHGRHAGWTPAGAEAMFAELRSKRIPVVDGDGFIDLAHRVLTGHVTNPFNAPSWGMGDQDFPEIDPG